MNATERIRAALLKNAASQGNEVRPDSTPPESQLTEPVESTLRLISTEDHKRAAQTEHPAAPPHEDPQHSPAVTVKILHSTLRASEQETLPMPAPAPTPPAAPPPANASAPSRAFVLAPDPEPAAVESTDIELRSWAAEIPAKQGRPKWLLIALAGAVVVVAAVAVVFRGAWLPGPSAPPAAVLQLAVESEDNGLISLRWNGQSAPVMEAREGRLWIVEDQKPPRQVPLKLGQLAAGHLFYESSSDRVEFQLEVMEKSGAVVRESTVAAKKPVPTSDATPVPAESQQQVAAVNPPADNPAASPLPGESLKPVQTARTFTPPPVPARERAGEGNVILMEPAPTLSGGSAAPAGGAILTERANIIPPPPSAAPRQSGNAPPAAPERVRVGGKLQSAMLLRKIDPVYPPLARQMRIQGLVRFQAVIGKDGEVRDLKFVSGPRVLEKAATEAVKHWAYRPTLLNGHPVEVSTEIEINFTLGT